MSDDFTQHLLETLPKIRRFSRSLSGSVSEGDDLAQEAVTIALGKKDLWQPGTRFDSWMYKIVQNLHVSGLRRSGVRKKYQQSLNGSQSWVEGGAEATADLRNVVSFVRSLPPEQQIVVVLVSVEGYSYAEAADLLGVAVGTVTSRLSRARAAIRRFQNE